MFGQERVAARGTVRAGDDSKLLQEKPPLRSCSAWDAAWRCVPDRLTMAGDMHHSTIPQDCLLAVLGAGRLLLGLSKRRCAVFQDAAFSLS
jgi:hypothetical protein